MKAFYADTDALELALSYTQIASWSLSLATNVIATLLISWRAWYMVLLNTAIEDIDPIVEPY